MSGRRLAEYLLVVGVDHSSQTASAVPGEAGGTMSPLSPLSPLAEHTSRATELNLAPQTPPDVRVSGTVLQRFPAADRPGTALPGGIEIFCQPLGWFLTFTAKSPAYVDFILTAEDSSRLYCTALNFHQLCKEQSPKKLNRYYSEGEVMLMKSNKMKKQKSEGRVVDFLDEGCEEGWTVKDAYGELYQPVSICILSKLPLFEIFQMCLKGLYISWVANSSPGTLHLEGLVVDLLSKLKLPPANCLPQKQQFGALQKLVLPPIHEDSTLPYTSTSVLWLLRRVGIRNLLQLVSAIISDFSILFISSSMTVLTSSLRALTSIIYPFKVSHSIVPVVPADLLEYTQLPSTYIMGVHSSLRRLIDVEMLEVVEVYLDIGTLEVPDSIKPPHFPPEVISHVQNALSRVIDPRYDSRDSVFHTPIPLPLGAKDRSEEMLEREVRAIFVCLMAVLVGDYQNFVTVLRFQPTPAFYFNLESYLANKEGGTDHQSLLYKMAESIAFFNFCHERSVPYRECDFFDELVARFASNPQDLKPETLFSWANIQELAEELSHQLPSCLPPGGPEYDVEGASPEALRNPLKRFPLLDGAVVKSRMAKNESENAGEEPEVKDVSSRKKIPLLDSTPTHHRKSSTYMRGLDSLTSCLDAIFQSKIVEARKYVPSVIQALKTGILSEELVPSLVVRFLQYGVLLSTEQFDLVVKLLNSALVDQQSAMMLLPLTTVIYKELNPGVHQHACTCVQNHYIWEKATFWRDAIYLAIQAELVRIYAEVQTDLTKMTKQQEMEDADEEDDVLDSEVGDITLRSRQRIRSSSPARLRKAKMLLTRSARLRMRASVVVPGVSEGVLPPNAKPVTSQEALHHLAKILSVWDSLSEEKQTNLVKIEENAVTNQLILFVQRVISLRTPVELPDDEEEQEQFIVELEELIAQVLKMVEVDLAIDVAKNKIREQVHDMILIHLDSMAGLRKELKRVPISKPKVIKPPLIPGEVLLYNIPAYLLQDGRDSNLMLPADGQVFLTSYRVIFLGTPCDPQAPNLIVTRSMPVSSMYRLKKLNPTQLPPPMSVSTVGGLQLRSTTAELLKIGFDDETSLMNIKNLEQHIIDIRNPSSITLGVRLLNPSATLTPENAKMSPDREILALTTSVSSRQQLRNKNKSTNVLSQSNTVTRMKLLSEISQSPCCQEYRRLNLGSVNFQDSTKGAWHATTINLAYAVCASYPAVLVVPQDISDDSLPNVASQFQHNRWPVVTWKHPKRDAVLLRSSSFIPSSITRKKFNIVSGKLLPSNITQKPTESESAARSGVGIHNKDVEGYIYKLMSISSSASKFSRGLVQQVSMPPPMIEFEEELKRQGSFRIGAPSPSPSNDSSEMDVDGTGFEIASRSRAQTFGFKIRTRVGSSVSQLSRVVLPEKKEARKSPAAKRRLSAARKIFSSPQLPRKSASDDSMSRHSSCSTASDVSMERMKERESLKEEPEEEPEEGEKIEEPKPAPRSANVSPTASKKPTHKRTRSSDQVVDLKSCDIDLKDIIVTEKTGSPEPPISPIDWEAVGSGKGVEKEGTYGHPSVPSTPEDDYRNSSPELATTRGSFKLQWDHFSEDKKPSSVLHSPGTFSTLPTNPRDYVVMDALPSEIRHWQANALYILGDKALLQDIPDDLYLNCMFVPVEIPSLTEVSNSFKKLMRACIPSSPQNTFFAAIQDSCWITQLTHLMQVGGAVADLIDIQGSSVLVCLENGWDATAQVVSIAEVLLDPYYRTLEGFKALVEKDWLAFGHRFSHNSSHTSATPISTFSPIFLQFLDVVHQIMKQFPLSFEFNDFYLRTLAYHHCSMRFHTFTADSEKERYAYNWLQYRPRTANIYGNSGQGEGEYICFWEHIDSLHKDSMLFYNFRYQAPNELDPEGPLRPYSYQANIDIWSFYLENNLSEFPSYDTELISEGPLTLLDMHHNFFEKERSLPLTGLRISQPGSVASEISSLLWEYTKLMNVLAEKQGLPQATWIELLDELLTSSPTDLYHTSISPVDPTIASHGQTLHKRTTLAVLIKGKLAVELETQFTIPHQFEAVDHKRGQHECVFCKLQLKSSDEKHAFKCRKCGCYCHSYCKTLVPYNCGQEKILRRRLSKRLPAKKSEPSILLHSANFPDGPIQQTQSEGYLYKRGKIVRNWKQRWFELDPEKGEMSYFSSNNERKCHGTIYLKDILSVQEAEPQVVPALKPGEQSFFFNVVTQKRVYHLMALRDIERTEWIMKIKHAISRP